MEKHDHGAVGGAGFGIADAQYAGIDLPQGSKRCVRARHDPGRIARTWLRLRIGNVRGRELGAGKGDDGRAQEVATATLDFGGHFFLSSQASGSCRASPALEPDVGYLQCRDQGHARWSKEKESPSPRITWRRSPSCVTQSVPRSRTILKAKASSRH